MDYRKNGDGVSTTRLPIISSGLKGMNLDRRGTFKRSIGFIATFLVLEISKQMTNYTMATRKNGKYPLPSSVIVLLCELFKLSIVFFYVKLKGDSTATFSISAKFSVPALCYFFSNIIYFTALTGIAPPVWMILVQTKTFYTAVVYKLIFGRSINVLQMLGCCFIVISIPAAHISDILLPDKKTAITITIIILSQMSAMLSTTAGVSIELMLKNDRRSFAEQQIWLYLFGSMFAAFTIILTLSSDELYYSIIDLESSDISMLCVCISITGCAGLCLPFIIKNLDIIVKDYIMATNNIVLSVITAVFFPDHFILSNGFLLSLLILVSGIILYERFSIKKKKSVKATSEV